MAQLVGRPLLIPEVRGSIPVIGKKLYIEHLFIVNCIEKMKIKEKEAQNVGSLTFYHQIFLSFYLTCCVCPFTNIIFLNSNKTISNSDTKTNKICRIITVRKIININVMQKK